MALELVRWPIKHEPAVLQHVRAVTDFQHLLHVLLNEEDRHSRLGNSPNGCHHLLYQKRGKPDARLIHDQHLGGEHQRSGNRHHLLLAARELPRGRISLGHQVRKQLGDSLETLCPLRFGSRQVSAEHEVFINRHVGEQLTAHRHVRQASPRHFMRCGTMDLFAVKNNAPTPGRDHSGNGAKNGRLPAAIPANQADQLAALHVQGNTKHHLDAAVAQVDIVNDEYRIGHQSVPK